MVLARNNWRTFGPTSEYSDGDAEYFQLTSRLSQQYEWFAPRPQQEEETASPEQDARQPEVGRRGASYGLTERQIHALGLSGPRTDMPDPVGAAWPGCLPAASPKPCRDEQLRPDLLCLMIKLQKTLSSKAYLRGEKFTPDQFGYNVTNMAGGNYRAGRSYTSPRAAYGDYPNYPEGRPLFLPEAERFGNPPDLPSLLLQQRVIYISMPVSKGNSRVWGMGPASLVRSS